jgi:hypothetical protein
MYNVDTARTRKYSEWVRRPGSNFQFNVCQTLCQGAAFAGNQDLLHIMLCQCAHQQFGLPFAAAIAARHIDVCNPD